LVITLKAGTGFDSPWIVVRGYDPADVVNKLNSLDGVIEATLEAAGLFTAQRSLGGKQQQAEVPPTEPAPQQRQQGWGQTPAAAQQGAAPAQHRGGQRGFQDPPHPEGKTCEHCPNVLVKKKSTGGKQKWQCPDWRWNNGNPTNHTVEWID
jgi:hypothetical protein